MWACLVISSATSCHRELIYCKCTGVLDSPYWETSVDKLKKNNKFTFNFISINHQVILIIIFPTQIIIMLIYLFKKDVSIDCNK